jgi:hypothetical protein
VVTVRVQLKAGANSVVLSAANGAGPSVLSVYAAAGS